MNKKGFMLMETIIAIFLIGLTASLFLPILVSNYQTISIIKLQGEMDYLSQYIFERLYSNDPYTQNLLVEMNDEVEFTDLDNIYLDKYKCRILNLDVEEGLWNLKVIVEIRNSGEEIPYVELYGTIPKQ